MPTYEYRCTECDHHFETRQRITEDPLTKCPECGKHNLKKVITSTGGFRLKGSGWYKDGY